MINMCNVHIVKNDLLGLTHGHVSNLEQTTLKSKHIQGFQAPV